nr:YibE/F family protein [bacterium]
NDRYLRAGDKIVISYQVVGDEAKIAFSDFVRTGQIGFLIFIFVVLLLVISGFKGIRSIISFGWVLLNIIYFIRGVLAGNNVYLLVLVMAISIVVGSSIILVGWDRKMWLVVLSSLFGLLISTILVLGVGHWAHFSEIGLEDANLFHLSGALKDLDYVRIIYAGMIIGALGSMMDITISIVAGVEETINMIKEKKVRRFEKNELFESGLNIGREIMVVNANTLILAYAGSSITIWLIAISQGYSGGLLWNFNMIFVEVLRILAGTIGIFATIPIAAWLSSRMMIFERSYSFESEEQ